jgi:hypothetical protein
LLILNVAVDWGIKIADELNVNNFLDSAPYGRLFYEAKGFEHIEENVNIPVADTDNPADSWKEVEEKVGPFIFWLMRRPAKEGSKAELT